MGSCDKSILFLLNHFNDSECIHDLVENLSRLSVPSGWTIGVAINDNSRNLCTAKLMDFEITIDVYVPNSNLGYLKGCGYALKKWMSDYKKVPEIAAICNADIVLSENIVERIASVKSGSFEIGVIAPDIILPDGTRQNPYRHMRISRTRLLLLRQIYRSSILYKLQNFAHRLRVSLASKDTVHSKTMKIYACHGSVFFLTKNFLQRSKLESFEPLMTGEELFVAEECRRHDLSVVFAPDLHVRHNEHTSTSKASLTTRRLWRLESTEFILKSYFSRSRRLPEGDRV